MKLFKRMKDGGPESRVTGFFLVEIKRLFSVAFLRFGAGSREAYHTHAFPAVSWVLWGELTEYDAHTGAERARYRPSLRPVYTPRHRYHKVVSTGTTLALTFRGPWRRTWREYLPAEGRELVLTHGRKEV